jgi:tripartite-type tricarboxylate transporter receptor subunit TctC
MHRTFAAAIEDPTIRQRLGVLGLDVKADGHEAFGAFLDAEMTRWARLIEANGIRAE